MSSWRDPIPDDLKEFIALIRIGKLFAIQQWIAEGKRFRMPDGNFITWPLRTAVDTGFHSIVEVLLQAGMDQDDKDYALSHALSDRRLDLIELLIDRGDDAAAITAYDVISTRHPQIIRWFLNRGLDLEEGLPIARAFQYRHREFLGIYVGLRDKYSSARTQAAMALRYHAKHGNLKWVSLLMWAGADPPMVVAMASEFKRRQMWWIKFRHPATGQSIRESLETADEARAELLRQRLDLEVALCDPRFKNPTMSFFTGAYPAQVPPFERTDVRRESALGQAKNSLNSFDIYLQFLQKPPVR